MVVNLLSDKFEVMRPSLLPGLLEAIAYNRRHGQRDVALFEIGARFSKSRGETRGVAIAWTGGAHGEHWSGTPREVDFFDVKGTVETLCEALGATVSLSGAYIPHLVPGQTASINGGGSPVGSLGRLSPAVVDRAGAPRHDAVFAAEIDLDRLATAIAPRPEWAQALPRHPAVVRDLSIIVGESLPAEIIRGTIHAAGDNHRAPLVRVVFFDRYRGKGVPDGSVSISVRLTFQAPDRTLTDRDVQQAFDRILSALGREHGAVQR
jgi:phenylalanyl-tRNA synthetase beta chain